MTIEDRVSKIKKMISTELKDDSGPVFMGRYPDEDDIRGWLKIYATDFMFGRSAVNALKEIQTQDIRLEQMEKILRRILESGFDISTDIRREIERIIK